MPAIPSAVGKTADKGKSRRRLKVEPCEICGVVLSRRSDASRHAKTHDSGAEKLPCPWEGCLFEALQKSNLKTHLRRHTQDRSYKCSDDLECKFQTCDPSSLLRHRKRFHGYTPQRARTSSRRSIRLNGACHSAKSSNDDESESLTIEGLSTTNVDGLIGDHTGTEPEVPMSSSYENQDVSCSSFDSRPVMAATPSSHIEPRPFTMEINNNNGDPGPLMQAMSSRNAHANHWHDGDPASTDPALPSISADPPQEWSWTPYTIDLPYFSSDASDWFVYAPFLGHDTSDTTHL